jgi:hypothetical protein
MNKNEQIERCQRQLILCKSHLENMKSKALYLDKEARKNALEACHHASEELSEVKKLLQPEAKP